jgi:ParB/RepB/Spo0J family partition protein
MIVTDIPIDKLVAHPRNVRGDVGDLTELAASIKAMGILQPLTVAPNMDGGYEPAGPDSTIMRPSTYIVIAGHRRQEAARKAGLATVPCLIRSDLVKQAAQIEAMLVENLQRTDLTVMEEADAYAQLELLGVKDAAIAKATGRAARTVKERRALAGLPTPRREAVEAGKLTVDAGVKIARLRAQWVDDAEILVAIDEASSWAFSDGSYGIDRTIERILDRRKPQPEPEDDDGFDYDGQRAEREAAHEQARLDREARTAAVTAATERMYDWLSGRLAVQAQTVVDGLLDWALEDILDNYSTDPALPMLGIEPCGEDEDVDDANLRIAAALKALPHQDKVIALALGVSGAATRQPYWFDEHARSMAAIGYPLTDDDKALMKAVES